MIHDDIFYSTREVSNILGITYSAIYMARSNGSLKAEKINRKWRYLGKDIRNYFEYKYDRIKSKYKGEKIFGEGKYSVRQVANFFRVKKEQIYHVIRKYRPPYDRKGSAYVFDNNSIEFIQQNSYIKNCRTKTKAFACLLSLYFLTSCTYNVSMAHTEGSASDVIDDTQSNTPDISPTITVPLTTPPAITSMIPNRNA
jgi:hypothetical protein